MTQALTAGGLLLLGAVVTFLSARYWYLQNGTIAEAKRLAKEHAQLVKRVTTLESDHKLLAQRVDLQRKCGT